MFTLNGYLLYKEKLRMLVWIIKILKPRVYTGLSTKNDTWMITWKRYTEIELILCGLTIYISTSIYMYIYFACLSFVCLYPINAKTAELIQAKFFWGNLHDPRDSKNVSPLKLIFAKNFKNREKNRIFFYCFIYCT